MKCAKCGHNHIGRKVWSGDAFRNAFKPGDIILGYSTKKRMLITAIGRDRFLYVPSYRSMHDRERVAHIGSYAWEKESNDRR